MGNDFKEHIKMCAFTQKTSFDWSIWVCINFMMCECVSVLASSTWKENLKGFVKRKRIKGCKGNM